MSEEVSDSVVSSAPVVGRSVGDVVGSDFEVEEEAMLEDDSTESKDVIKAAQYHSLQSNEITGRGFDTARAQ